MSIESTLGTRLFVSATLPATQDAAGYEALTWTEVDEITGLGTFGASAAEIAHNAINRGYTQYVKGQIDYGTLTVGMAGSKGDAGQAILKSGADGANVRLPHSVKILDASGDALYSYGPILSHQYSYEGGAIVGASSSIRMSAPLIYVAA